MSRSVPYSARQTALKVLRQYTAQRGDAAELLGALLEGTDRSGQATDLVYGVIRNSILLDRVLSVCAEVHKGNVKPGLWAILRLGVYELLYAPKTADYGIISEAVNLARGIGSHKSAGCVNAVLRSVQRHIAVRDGVSGAAAVTHSVPRADGSVCVFDTAVLPDPAVQSGVYLHLAWSLPQWLVQRWVTVYGPAAAAICRASNRHPSVYAWPNTQRIGAEALMERFGGAGVSCRLWGDRGAIQLCGAGWPAGLDAFREGLFYIQDPAAEAMASFLDPQPGETVVDVCAAPGGKTLALALHMKDRGCIVASDVHADRLRRVDENVRRLALSCVRSLPAAALPAYVQSLARVDAVVVDVPCSNTGVLARRVEARRRLDRRPDASILKVQASLLETAGSLLKPGGKLLYSTCSILPEENEDQIQYFLGAHRGFTLVKQIITLPSTEKADFFDHDGGYMALLKAL